MNERRCKECGHLVPEGAVVCPDCGCPIESAEKRNSEAMTVSKFTVRNPLNLIMPIVSLLIGICIVIMGMNVMKKEVKIDTYNAKRYSVEYAAFGGDFYTEIYGASDVIVDELSDINGGIALMSESMTEMANVIYYPVGMMITALGLGVIALSCCHIKKSNS